MLRAQYDAGRAKKHQLPSGVKARRGIVDRGIVEVGIKGIGSVTMQGEGDVALDYLLAAFFFSEPATGSE